MTMTESRREGERVALLRHLALQTATNGRTGTDATDGQTIAVMTAMTGQAEETALREEMMIEALVGVPGQLKTPFDSQPAKDSEAQTFKEEERGEDAHSKRNGEAKEKEARATKGIRVEDALSKAEEGDTKEAR